MTVVELKEISKSFKGKKVVRNVSLSIEAGEIVAILGPNGAGKTTTMNMMLGLLNSDGGSVKVFGREPKDIQVREKLGAMLQDVSIIDGLKVKELLTLFASYYPRSLAVKQLLSISGLEAEAKTYAEKLSGGQKRRLGFALAIAGNPDLLFLDEPTVGMDIQSRRAFWETIQGFASKGKTIIFSTHYLQEVEDIASRVILFHKGAIVADGTPAAVKARLSTQVVSFEMTDLERKKGLKQLPAAKRVYEKAGRIYIETDNPDAVVAALYRQKGTITGLKIDEGRLEEAFEQLTTDGKGVS